MYEVGNLVGNLPRETLAPLAGPLLSITSIPSFFGYREPCTLPYLDTHTGSHEGKSGKPLRAGRIVDCQPSSPSSPSSRPYLRRKKNCLNLVLPSFSHASLPPPPKPKLKGVHPSILSYLILSHPAVPRTLLYFLHSTQSYAEFPDGGRKIWVVACCCLLLLVGIQCRFFFLCLTKKSSTQLEFSSLFRWCGAVAAITHHLIALFYLQYHRQTVMPIHNPVYFSLVML